MSRDRIEQLLREGDRVAGPPGFRRDGLADRVRLQVQRQRRWRLSGGAAAAGIAACAVLTLVQPGSHSQGDDRAMVRRQPASQRAGSTDIQQELATLRTEMQQLRGELRAALEDDRRPPGAWQAAMAEALAEAPVVDPLARFDQELERTAFLMVYQADRVYRELKLPDTAVRSYQKTIELFPSTNAASVARKRLTEIETSKGERL